MEELRADVDRAVSRGADVDGRVPIETELSFLIERQRLDVPGLMRLSVDATDVPALRLRIDVLGISGIDEHPKAVAAVHVLPLTFGDSARVLRRADPGAVVLQTAIHFVRSIHVETHMIELRDRQRLTLPPSIATVVRVPDAA